MINDWSPFLFKCVCMSYKLKRKPQNPPGRFLCEFVYLATWWSSFVGQTMYGRCEHWNDVCELQSKTITLQHEDYTKSVKSRIGANIIRHFLAVLVIGFLLYGLRAVPDLGWPYMRSKQSDSLETWYDVIVFCELNHCEMRWKVTILFANERIAINAYGGGYMNVESMVMKRLYAWLCKT